MNNYLEETFKELKDYEATLKGVEAERANALWESDKAAWYGQQTARQAMGLQLGRQAAELALLQAQTKKTEVYRDWETLQE